MWTTREIDGVARALREVADALAEASSEAKSRDARRARDDDDEDDGPALGAVKGATLAGNCAVKLREALERVEAHAGEAFRDVEGATKAAAEAADDPTSSGAEADGEASEVESERRAVREPVVAAPPPAKAEKPQWMVELAAKNAAKRAAQNSSDAR